MGTCCLAKGAGGSVRAQEVVEDGDGVEGRQKIYRERIDLIGKKRKTSRYLKYECLLQKELCAIVHNNERAGIFLFTQALALRSQLSKNKASRRLRSFLQQIPTQLAFRSQIASRQGVSPDSTRYANQAVLREVKSQSSSRPDWSTKPHGPTLGAHTPTPRSLIKKIK